jgi:DNA-binding NarL/FixJ family response regulator
MIRVFIVDDHPIMRLVLREIVDLELDMEVCGEAGAAEEALTEMASTESDLAIVDVSLPGMSGIALAGQLRQQYPDLVVVMLSGHRERRHIEQALDAGASGYILKGHTEDLPMAIRQVVQGKQYLTEGLLS